MNLSRPARLQHLATALCSLFQPFLGRGEAGPAFGFLVVRAPGLCLPQEVAMRGRGAGREPRGGCPEARPAPGCRLPGGVFLARGPGAMVVEGSAGPSSHPAPSRATPSFSLSGCLGASALWRISNSLLPAAWEKSPPGGFSAVIRSSRNLLS